MCAVTGLPVRTDVVSADREFSRAELGIDERPLVLSFGGSLGARKLNEAVAELIANMHGSKSCCFLHATGQYGLWMSDLLKEKGVEKT